MTLFKNKYRIETTRLRGWDYSRDGYYFVTVCIKNRENLLGGIFGDTMKLNEYGVIVNDCWIDLPNHYSNIKLDAFCIMPNHIHGIIVIDNGKMVKNAGIVDSGFKPESTILPLSMVSPIIRRHGLFEFVRALKTFSARRINELRKSVGKNVWQSRFYDHIIRNDESLQRIRNYIVNNTKSWHDDTMYN